MVRLCFISSKAVMGFGVSWSCNYLMPSWSCNESASSWLLSFPFFPYCAFFRRCSSYLGRMGGPQRISLVDGCLSHGTITHEFLHALGFHHEQKRPDRDGWIKINWENIIPGRTFPRMRSSLSRPSRTFLGKDCFDVTFRVHGSMAPELRPGFGGGGGESGL